MLFESIKLCRILTWARPSYTRRTTKHMVVVLKNCMVEYL